jgi:acid phosphatase type 7
MIVQQAAPSWFPRFPAPPKTAEEAVTTRHEARPNEQFEPLPAPTAAYPFRLRLEDVLPTAQVDAIKSSGQLTFHCVGDTGGVKDPAPQEAVAEQMERDLEDGGSAPSFFYHLGDVVYFYGAAGQYYPQFYEPYARYSAPIFACPGNHDGSVDPSSPGVASLAAFVENFCAPTARHTPAAGEVNRAAMTQPNVYWTLLAPFVTIVGLYTNVPEGGLIADDQLRWLIGELKEAPPDQALILALHHPIYSADTVHGSNLKLASRIHDAFAAAGRAPDAVFSGHVHNYQRFTSVDGGREIPYVVAGGGGYHNLHRLAKHKHGGEIQPPWKLPLEDDITLVSYDDRHYGCMRVTAAPGKLSVQYEGVAKPSHGRSVKITDSWALDTSRHCLAAASRA